MKTNYITIRPDRLNFPLDQCAVGRLSSAVFTVGGEIPDDIEAIGVRIEYADDGSTETYTAIGVKQADGTWRVYIAPAYFPAESTELKYHVIGTDSNGNPRWLGTGCLRIIENPARGSSVVPDIVPRNSYAYNPVTGLYYKIWAEVNELGEITLTTDQEGIAL